MSFPRKLFETVRSRLSEFPAVALLGPRQVGKTTLARQLSEAMPGSSLLDLERAEDRRKLSDPGAYLSSVSGHLLVLDEIHRAPEIFAELRVQIDERRRAGKKTGHFLILGSAALTLLRQSSESLAGRICFLELTPLLPAEVNPQHALELNERLWLRGGFPESFLAGSNAASLRWRRAFIQSYLERDIPQFGIRIPSETLERFWTMLAHLQGSTLNAQRLATSLSTSWHTVSSYLDLMVDLFLIRRLQPWASNIGKRLVKAPKIYVRDSGLLHALLNLTELDELLSHPVVGFSWEGFAIETLIASLPEGMKAYYYRTATGNEIDLLLHDGKRKVAVEFKRSRAPLIEPSFLRACDDVGADESWLVYPGDSNYPAAGGVQVMPIQQAADILEQLANA